MARVSSTDRGAAGVVMTSRIDDRAHGKIKPLTPQSGARGKQDGLRSLRRRDRALGHVGDEMGTVFRARMDIAMEPGSGHLDVGDRLGREGLRERRFHVLLAEDTGTRARHPDPYPRPGLRHEDAYDGVA